MNSKISIGSILTEAWKIFWKFKIIWVFGILANSVFSIYQSLNQGASSYLSGLGRLGPDQLPNFLKYVQPEAMPGYLMTRYGGWMAAGFALSFALLVLGYYLSVMGRTAIMKVVAQADNGAASAAFGEAWSQAGPYFWRMFWLDSILMLPLTIWMTILAGGLWLGILATATLKLQGGGMAALMGGLLVFMLGGMCLMLIVSIFLGLIAQLAYNAIALDELGAVAALKQGWKVFKSAWLSIAVLTILMSVIGGGLGLLIATPIQLGLAALGGLLTPAQVGLVSFIIYLPVLMLLYGILPVFYQTGWTLLYRRLTAAAAEPIVSAPEVLP